MPGPLGEQSPGGFLFAVCWPSRCREAEGRLSSGGPGEGDLGQGAVKDDSPKWRVGVTAGGPNRLSALTALRSGATGKARREEEGRRRMTYRLIIALRHAPLVTPLGLKRHVGCHGYPRRTEWVLTTLRGGGSCRSIA